jgi:predicted RND superfamily exporter protein
VVALSDFPLLASFGASAVNVIAAMICALVILPPSCAPPAHAGG